MRARKRFGQHVLEPAWVAKLVAVIDPRPEQTFLEIGPGRGALTKALAPRTGRLVAVEIDRDLAAALPERVPDTVRATLQDGFEVDIAALYRRGDVYYSDLVGTDALNELRPFIQGVVERIR